MNKQTKSFILAIAVLSLVVCMGLDRAGGMVAQAANPLASGKAAGGQAPSIFLGQAPLAVQVAVAGLALLFILVAVAPAFLREREVVN